MTAVEPRTPPDRETLSPSFPVLDTMRAVGSLAVVATHTSFWAGAYTIGAFWGTSLARLDIGVAIFFVLSGFLLSRPHIARAAYGLPRPSVGRYFWKRFLRIMPVYVVAASLALLLLPENESADFATWVHTLTLTNIYVSPGLPAGLSQMWSLATEVAFYVFLPALMAAALIKGRLTRRGLTALLLAMFAATVVWVLSVAPLLTESRMAMQWLPSYLTWFGAGIAVAWAHVEWQRASRPRALLAVVAELGRSPGVCWTAGLALFAVSATPLAGPALLLPSTLAQALTKNLLYAVIAALVLLPGVFAPRSSRFAAFMSRRALRHLGHISYSIFCIHLLILHGVMDLLGYELFTGHGWTIFAVTAALSILAAELLYRFVERPFMSLRTMKPPWRDSAVTSHTRESSTRY